MTERFKFTYKAMDYEVIGNYATDDDVLSNNEVRGIFIVTKFPAGAPSASDTSGTPSGVNVLNPAPITAANREVLLGELNNIFPKLTGFVPF